MAKSLRRILDEQDVARVVRRLEPTVLHRVIQACGLEDCGDLVAMATPAQLQRVFDLDLWRAARPGLDEQLDADRFATWLEVLMEYGVEIAAEKLVAMDAELVIAALAKHVRVFDRAAVPDGSRRDRLGCDVASYLVEARRTDAWEPVVTLLLHLDAIHPDYLHRVMRGCRKLSNAGFEIDGLHDLLPDAEQDMFDLADDRELRREKQGYVAPADARAFLDGARRIELTARAAPPPDPIAVAYFRGADRTPHDEDAKDREGRAEMLPKEPSPSGLEAEAVAALIDDLRSAGVLPNNQPRALLEGATSEPPRLVHFHAFMRACAGETAASKATAALAYLANALVAGCPIQGRAFTPREASDAVAAICNLGLENWRDSWDPPRDLIGAFQVGWTVLHDDVCMYAADRLMRVVAGIEPYDADIQAGLDRLRFEMMRHWRAGAPWRARAALDLIVILDQAAWAALLGLIDECPVVHAALDASRSSSAHAIDPIAFDFISENRQIESIHQFLGSLRDAFGR